MADERDQTQQQPAGTEPSAVTEPPAVSEQEASQALTEGAEQSVGDKPADETMVELPPSGEERPPAPPPVEAGPPAAPAVQEGPAPDAPPINAGPPSPVSGQSPVAAQRAAHEQTGPVDKHPEYFAGGVFAAGFVLAQILKRFGND